MAEEEEKAEAAEEAPAEEAPAAEETPAEETPAEEAPAEEAPAEEAPAEETPAEEKPAAPAPAAAAAPSEPGPTELPPKERRRIARTAHGEALPQRSGEERAAERIAARKAKAAERRRYRQGRGKARKEAIETGEGTAPAERVPGKPKFRQGIVVSDKMDKTITVRVASARRHPAYEKVIRTSKMYHAHDERNEANPGDTVRLIETRPMSKTKHWRLTEILERAK